MKKSAINWAVVFMVGFQASVQAAINITYTTDYANANDTPNFGTMIDPSDYYGASQRGDVFGVGGSLAKAYGNTLDQGRVYVFDWAYPSDNPFEMLKWDMGSAGTSVRVYPDVEHGGGNAWDYLQWSLWGSNNPAENSGAWTLLWDPTAGTGTSVNDFMVTAVGGSAISAKVYRYGTNLDVGTVPNPGDAYGDAFTIDLSLPESYRYFGLRGSTMALYTGSLDPEINAIATGPMGFHVIPAPGAFALGGIGFCLVNWLRKRRPL